MFATCPVHFLWNIIRTLNEIDDSCGNQSVLRQTSGVMCVWRKFVIYHTRSDHGQTHIPNGELVTLDEKLQYTPTSPKVYSMLIMYVGS